MRRAILFSEQDRASLLVKQVCIENLGFKESDEVIWGRRVIRYGDVVGVTSLKHHLYLSPEEIAELGCELVVVASSHRSEKGVDALLTHATGNWTERAEYGGLPRALSKSMAGAVKVAALKLKEGAERSAKLSSWQVGLEATHHGPYSDVPLLYVEFGGSEEGLKEYEAAEVVAEACLAAANSQPSKETYVGFGGNHYAPKFTSMTFEGEGAFGHIAPNYVMPVSRELIEQALARVVEHVKAVVLDWKGLRGEHRQMLIKTFEELGIDYDKA